MDEGLRVAVACDALPVLAKAMRAEADGKQLRKELIAEMRTALAPGVSAVQSKLRAIPRSATDTASPALGIYLASRVRTQVRLSGKSAGVKIRIPQTPQLRGFRFAARRLNRDAWRHPVFGNRENWVEQQSPIQGFFDDTLRPDRAKMRGAVIHAMNKMAFRIAHRI